AGAAAAGAGAGAGAVAVPQADSETAQTEAAVTTANFRACMRIFPFGKWVRRCWPSLRRWTDQVRRRFLRSNSVFETSLESSPRDQQEALRCSAFRVQPPSRGCPVTVCLARRRCQILVQGLYGSGSWRVRAI